MIKYSQPSISTEDVDAVSSVLLSGNLTQSEVVQNFEISLQKYIGTKFGVKAVSSATAALETVYRALGVKTGSLIWTTPITFVATANAACILGAEVDFVDIDKNTYNLCPQALEEKLIHAARIGKLPDVIVPVHLAGEPCDMSRIRELSKIYEFLIVEDASHAFGSIYNGTKIGTMQYSDAVVFSHHAIKNLTTGEGGSFLIKCADRFSKAVSFVSHGITRNKNDLQEFGIPDFYYCQKQIGTNQRMTALQAALGESQLKKFDELQSKRAFVARYYSENLITKSQLRKDYNVSANHLFIVEFDGVGVRNERWQYLRDKGIETNLHYWPVHKQPFHLKNDRPSLPHAESYGNTALSIPCHAGLSLADLEFIVDQVNFICT